MKDLLLIGGGHSHAIALDLLRRRPLADTRITLVSNVEKLLYSGMVPGLVAGLYGENECRIDLARLCAGIGARFVLADAVSLDPVQRLVSLSDTSALSYDVLSLACGSQPPRQQMSGAEAFTIPVKPLEGFLAAWKSLIAQVPYRSAPLRILIVGGGAGGVEIALAMKDHLGERCSVMLVERSSHLLSDHAQRARRIATRALLKAGIDLRLDAPVLAFQNGQAVLGTDEQLLFDVAFLVTGAQGPAWLDSAGLATDDHGFVRVNAGLQSVSHPSVFASGDMATLVGQPRPKSGVYAVRQGPPLLENLRRKLAGKPLIPYRPQKRALSLLGTGSEQALLSWGSLAMESKFFWNLKKSIDQRFIRRFREAHL